MRSKLTVLLFAIGISFSLFAQHTKITMEKDLPKDATISGHILMVFYSPILTADIETVTKALREHYKGPFILVPENGSIKEYGADADKYKYGLHFYEWARMGRSRQVKNMLGYSLRLDEPFTENGAHYWMKNYYPTSKLYQLVADFSDMLNSN